MKRHEMMRTLLIAAALIVGASAPARSDGAYGPPVGNGDGLRVWVPAVRPPILQKPPTRSCVETAIQLGYMTSSTVGIAAVEACKIYAPILIPDPGAGVPPLGGYPVPR